VKNTSNDGRLQVPVLSYWLQVSGRPWRADSDGTSKPGTGFVPRLRLPGVHRRAFHRESHRPGNTPGPDHGDMNVYVSGLRVEAPSGFAALNLKWDSERSSGASAWRLFRAKQGQVVTTSSLRTHKQTARGAHRDARARIARLGKEHGAPRPQPPSGPTCGNRRTVTRTSIPLCQSRGVACQALSARPSVRYDWTRWRALARDHVQVLSGCHSADSE
jgi:hypothetical protein